MADGVIPLANDFPAPNEAQWRLLVDKTLDGQSFEKKLLSRTYEGLAIEPLYTAHGAVAPQTDAVRAAPAADPERPWDLRVHVDNPDPAVANALALAELEGGAASLLVTLDPTGREGVAIGDKADLERVLDGVHLDLAPIALDAGFLGSQAANWLGEIAEARTLNPTLLLHMDPFSAFAKTGASPGPINDWVAAAGRTACRLQPAGAFLASGQVVHEAGGGEAQELGFMAAAVLAYARAAIEAGEAVDAAFDRIVLGLASDAEYFSTLAKIRAARAIWARITEASLGQAVPGRIEARSSRRMLSTLDPWVNMLRLTAAGFGAAISGADAIVLDAFSQPLGRATPFARRQSRNTQLVLMEEAALGTVADPAGGSWYVESLTDEFARAGWAYMQKIEAAGGIVAALESGWIAADVRSVRLAREADIAKRKTGLIGVSEFPDLSPRSVEIDVADYSDFAKPLRPLQLPGPGSACDPMTPWKAADAFEALRSRSRALAKPPSVFLATLGSPADYSARAAFVRNLFAAGGVSANHGTLGDYSVVQTPIAVICASDALYNDQANTAAKVLKAAGVGRIYLAGRPGALEGALRAEGVEHFLYAGMDVVDALDNALGFLERSQ